MKYQTNFIEKQAAKISELENTKRSLLDSMKGEILKQKHSIQQVKSQLTELEKKTTMNNPMVLNKSKEEP
jgi:hypothetical protein